MPRTKKEYPIFVEGYPTVARNAWWSAKKVHPKSRKKAIRAMCLLCLGGSVKEVTECTDPNCPLYDFRITG